MVMGVNLLFLLLLTYALAQLTWRLLPAPEPLPPSPVLVQAVVAPTPGLAAAVAEVANWHLFGRKDPTAAGPVPDALPDTRLGLMLRGLLASTDPRYSLAIVADPAGQENYYKVGDSLPGGAELHEIHADRIVLRRAGQYETLRLPKEGLDLQSNAPGMAAPSVSTSAPMSGAPLVSYRQALVNNPQQLADLIHIEAAQDGNRFRGYRLQPGRDPSFMARYGLRPGDVVTRINGVTLDNPAKGVEAMRQLSEAPMIDLEVERNGVREQFMLPVE
jgi:general secretion pathway protein C